MTVRISKILPNLYSTFNNDHYGHVHISNDFGIYSIPTKYEPRESYIHDKVCEDNHETIFLHLAYLITNQIKFSAGYLFRCNCYSYGCQ